MLSYYYCIKKHRHQSFVPTMFGVSYINSFLSSRNISVSEFMLQSTSHNSPPLSKLGTGNYNKLVELFFLLMHYLDFTESFRVLDV